MASKFDADIVSTIQENYGIHTLPTYRVDVAGEYRAWIHDEENTGILHDEYSPIRKFDQPSPGNVSPLQRSREARDIDGYLVEQNGVSYEATDIMFPHEKPRRARRGILDCYDVPMLPAPLSELTKDLSAPIKDTEAWVNRSTEERHREVEKRGNGHITRPMNSFLLYRSAYADRTKQWCDQNSHQIVSKVAGISWAMESNEFKSKFLEWSKQEHANHAAAFPKYKFQPTKAVAKRRIADLIDQEEDPSGADNHFVEHRELRNVKSRRSDAKDTMLCGLPETDQHQHYDQQAGDAKDTNYEYHGGGQSVASSEGHDSDGPLYRPEANEYAPGLLQQTRQIPYVPNFPAPRIRTSTTIDRPSLGGFGLPGSHSSSEDIFPSPVSPLHAFATNSQQNCCNYDAQHQSRVYLPHPQSTVQLYRDQHYSSRGYTSRTTVDSTYGTVLSPVSTAPVVDGYPPFAFEAGLGGAIFPGLAGLDSYYQQPRDAVEMATTLKSTWPPSSYK